MTESELHRTVKNGIALALSKAGFTTKTEYKKDGEGRIDVYAEKSDGELVKVEVVKTHIPNWLLVKLDETKGPHNGCQASRVKVVRIYESTYDYITANVKYQESFADTLKRLVKK